MPRVDISAIDVEWVFELYSVRNSLAKDVAFTMGISLPEVKEALRVRALRERPKPPKRLPQVKLTKQEKLTLRRAERFERTAINFDFNRGEDGDYLDPRTAGAFQLFCQLATKQI